MDRFDPHQLCFSSGAVPTHQILTNSSRAAEKTIVSWSFVYPQVTPTGLSNPRYVSGTWVTKSPWHIGYSFECLGKKEVP